MAFRFVQTSDLHLGSPMTASSLRLPAAKAEVRRGELRALLGQICALAEDEAVDALLIPGDLFDDEAVTFEDLGFAIEQFERMTRPVVIAPGNHDYVSAGSVYGAEYLRARYGLRWPANVHIFRRQAWEDLYLDGGQIVGLGFETHVSLTERLLGSPLRRRSDAIQVLLFHGSRQSGSPPGKLMTLPFSDDELAQSSCDYAAIGHYHDFTPISIGGRLRGAYSGCPAGRGLDECGEKVVLVGEIDESRAVSLKPVRIDRREVRRLPVDCGGCRSNESIVAAIEEQLRRTGCGQDDIVSVELQGAVPPDLAVRLPEQFLRDRFFYLNVDGCGLRPAYDLAQYADGKPAADTTEGRFVRTLLGDLESAEAGGDERRARVVRQAIEYGLDALRGAKVQPRAID